MKQITDVNEFKIGDKYLREEDGETKVVECVELFREHLGTNGVRLRYEGTNKHVRTILDYSQAKYYYMINTKIEEAEDL